MSDYSRAGFNDGATASKEGLGGALWASVITLIIWLLAGAVVFLPFVLNTSPWDAVRLRVPGNQGNWRHVLVGFPFFLAFPIIWLRFRALASKRLSSAIGATSVLDRRWYFCVRHDPVEVPFLLHLAGTSQWQRLWVIGLGFTIVIASSILLFRTRRYLSRTRACIIGVSAAYLANAALCLVVYASAPGTLWSRSGWLVTVVIVWPMVLELIWLFAHSFTAQHYRDRSL